MRCVDLTAEPAWLREDQVCGLGGMDYVWPKETERSDVTCLEYWALRFDPLCPGWRDLGFSSSLSPIPQPIPLD